jgi:hypothetical protein
MEDSGVPWAVVALVLALVGCSGKDTTTGRRVTLQTRAVADAETEGEFLTSFGWNVKLDRAAVAVGPLYYFDGEPAFVQHRAPRRGPIERFASFFGEGVAHAHPGHYQAGDALGQMLEGGSVDLFRTPAKLGTGDGVSGTYRSARFTLAKKDVGSAAKELAGHVAFAEGTATKDGDAGAPTIHFRVSADFADVAKSVTDGAVDGCEFKEVDLEEDGTVTLTFKPSVWLDLVDFSKVDPGTAEAPTEIPHGDIAQIGFALGLVQLSAYHFGYSK